MASSRGVSLAESATSTITEIPVPRKPEDALSEERLRHFPDAFPPSPALRKQQKAPQCVSASAELSFMI